MSNPQPVPTWPPRLAECQFCGARILWIPGVRRPVDTTASRYYDGAEGLVFIRYRRHRGVRYSADVKPAPAEHYARHECPEYLAARLKVTADQWEALIASLAAGVLS